MNEEYFFRAAQIFGERDRSDALMTPHRSEHKAFKIAAHNAFCARLHWQEALN